SVTRECKSAMASLNLAANRDERITKRPWKLALAALPGNRKAPRNRVLSDDTIRKVVAASYQVSESFGLFIEVMAVTGARPVQVSRLLVEDVRNGFVMMPRSKKGRAKRIDRRPLPLPTPLLKKLKAAAGKRPGAEPLLLRDNGTAWQPANS